ncbi:MAG TPA: hypothetical protein VM869_20905 [Enhygromyxa sp.]|nr:hypothetical protein [Enhygromyxa sp.]
MRARQRIQGSAGFIICDARHLPIVVVRWFGTPELALVTALAQWMDQLLDTLEREQLRAAMVLDISHSDPPDSDNRRAMVAARTAKLPRLRERLVADLLVVNRPAVRAVITAMNWISPHVQATPATSLDEALRRCHEALAREGIIAPRLTAIEFEAP